MMAQAHKPEHGEERDHVAARRREPDRSADVDDREDDRRVEHPPRPIRPRLEVPAALAPDEEEEERDARKNAIRAARRSPRAPARARARRPRPRSGPRLRGHAPSGSRRSASRSGHGATNAEGRGDECRDGEPEQPPPGIGGSIEPRREDDAERDAAVDVVQLVARAVVARRAGAARGQPGRSAASAAGRAGGSPHR